MSSARPITSSATVSRPSRPLLKGREMFTGNLHPSLAWTTQEKGKQKRNSNKIKRLRFCNCEDWLTVCMFQVSHSFLNKKIWIYVKYLNEGRTMEVSSLLISLDTPYLPFCTTTLTVSNQMRTKCSTRSCSLFLLERNEYLSWHIDYMFVLGCLYRLANLRMKTDPC